MRNPRLKPGQVSLERALSKLGIASRTVARRWIEEGKVQVNGVIRKDPLYPTNPERARIEIEGRRIGKTRPVTFVLNKPKGLITTHSDEKGRQTVFSLLREDIPHLIAVGRLDAATTGLLLITNQTRLAAWLTDPAQAIPRTYLVTVRGEVTEDEINNLRAGIRDEGELLQAASVQLRKASGRESHLTVTLTEGKNREIRRMFLSLGHEVTRLKRVAFGALELGELEPGQYRELSQDEILRAFPEAPIQREESES